MPFLEDQFGDWKPVSRYAGIAWLSMYGLFLLYAAFDRSGFLFPDYVNLMFHEAGHVIFSWLGRTIMILGGTLGELLVPLICAIYFFTQREVFGVAFSVFWFFENFPYIGTYMADARAGALPLVGGGEHDWEMLFTQWGLIMQDQSIGGTVRFLGWLGMFGTMAWFAYRIFVADRDASPALSAEPRQLS
ncbi:MAG TPA: hypothetical protein VFF42_03055 [Candidatus Eremiobacteraceae bacterium]|nr:hypothetical protein [Candidatus Eremiobacteraceae bacterium]